MYFTYNISVILVPRISTHIPEKNAKKNSAIFFLKGKSPVRADWETGGGGRGKPGSPGQKGGGNKGGNNKGGGKGGNNKGGGWNNKGNNNKGGKGNNKGGGKGNNANNQRGPPPDIPKGPPPKAGSKELAKAAKACKTLRDAVWFIYSKYEEKNRLVPGQKKDGYIINKQGHTVWGDDWGDEAQDPLFEYDNIQNNNTY
jgi:hypothetical protein